MKTTCYGQITNYLDQKGRVRYFSAFKMAADGKKLIREKGDLRMVPVDESLTSPFTLSEPKWIPDAQVYVVDLQQDLPLSLFWL